MFQAQKGNVDDLYLLSVVVTGLFAVWWHDEPAKFGRKDGDEKPDPAVLFSRRGSQFPNPLLSVMVRTITESLRMNNQMHLAASSQPSPSRHRTDD